MVAMTSGRFMENRRNVTRNNTCGVVKRQPAFPRVGQSPKSLNLGIPDVFHPTRFADLLLTPIEQPPSVCPSEQSARASQSALVPEVKHCWSRHALISTLSAVDV